MADLIRVAYRHGDADTEAQRIARSLRDIVGADQVMVDSLSCDEAGNSTHEDRHGLPDAKCLIVVIGPDWLRALRAGCHTEGGHPFDKATDAFHSVLATSLATSDRIILPVLVRDASIQAAVNLPQDIRDVLRQAALELRHEHWNHDVRLLAAQFTSPYTRLTVDDSSVVHYPQRPVTAANAIESEILDEIVATELSHWSLIGSLFPGDVLRNRIELTRDYRFPSFRKAIDFMGLVAPGCDILNHHPRWENNYKTLRVFLTTWDIGHRVSDRDLQLARYFDRAFMDYLSQP